MTVQRCREESNAVLKALKCTIPPKHKRYLDSHYAKLQQELEWFQANSDVEIGSVMFASGMQRRRNEACLDYALIGVPAARAYYNDVS